MVKGGTEHIMMIQTVKTLKLPYEIMIEVLSYLRCASHTQTVVLRSARRAFLGRRLSGLVTADLIMPISFHSAINTWSREWVPNAGAMRGRRLSYIRTIATDGNFRIWPLIGDLIGVEVDLCCDHKEMVELWPSTTQVGYTMRDKRRKFDKHPKVPKSIRCAAYCAMLGNPLAVTTAFFADRWLPKPSRHTFKGIMYSLYLESLNHMHICDCRRCSTTWIIMAGDVLGDTEDQE